jgi:two-component system, NtrC family, response regulator HydG
MTSRMDIDFRNDPRILSRIVDVIPHGVFTVDQNGIIVGWSVGAERITGYSSADVVGKSCHILEGSPCKGASRIMDLLENPNPSGITNQECKFVAKDGQEHHLLGNVRHLTDEQGQTLGAVGIFTDVTSVLVTNEKITLHEEQPEIRTDFHGLVGESPQMREVSHRLQLAGQSDVTVLLRGESGTGKELAAKAIHTLSSRGKKPFIAVNCSAIPETLLESEFFGHVKGAFTGAVQDKVGMFQAGDKGTLFLDEIGDMSQLLQLKLLRVLQEREIRRVGDDHTIKVDVRLITATHKDLASLLHTGVIREDFYYRIRVFEIALPPLRERREDIPVLVNHFITKYSRSTGKRVKGIARDALQRMTAYPWPGNVRELQHAIEHAFVTVTGDSINLLDLPPQIYDPRPHRGRLHPELSLTAENQIERRRIEEALQQSGGNRTDAAKILGISRVSLWKKMRGYGIRL